ncbi:PIN domain-containing protein [Acinetobacter radioresistens]|uniref:PIN domain-containing protein n=1 Tax=Acinetobacter radioresistens TaxID=40216 RepID=UPI003B286F45
MMPINYDAIIIDTSIFDGNGLNLEGGLIEKLRQFKRSPTDLIIPDVIEQEVLSHLSKTVQDKIQALNKAIGDAKRHIFEGSESLLEAAQELEIKFDASKIAESRLKNFIDNTNAKIIKCGDYTDISTLVNQYFTSSPPFSDKKKNEFPDAIVLNSIKKWSELEKKYVLIVSKDNDWESYCNQPSVTTMEYYENLSDALALFNNNPFLILEQIEKLIQQEDSDLINNIGSALEFSLNGFSPTQDADSFFYWEPDGCDGSFSSFSFTSDQCRVIDHSDNYIVLEAEVEIIVNVVGQFSLYSYDTCDGDHDYVGSVESEKEQKFETKILITLIGNITEEAGFADLEIENVEIVKLPERVNFGTLEINFD